MLLSGLVGAVVDRLTVKAATNDPYLAATVTTADLSGSKYRTSGDAALIARARDLVLIYAAFNARQCAGTMLRLYKAKSTRGVKSRSLDRKRSKHVRNPNTVGLKAARWADMAGDVEEVTDHEVLDLLTNPNPFLRGTSFMQACFMQWELFGRRYIHVVGEGEPEELWPMGAQSVKILPSREGLIGGYRYGRSGEVEIDFNPEEVLYQRLFPSPFNPYDALGPLRMVVDEVDIYTASIVAELAMWQNGARPDWVLSVPPGTPDAQVRAVDSKINSTMRGPRKRGQFLITSITDVKALQFTPKEMEYLQGKQDLRKTIRAAYGIPESMDELNSANLASATMGHAQYARYTLQPRLSQDAEEWTETLLPKYGIEPGEMWFAYDNCIPSDEAAIRADAQTYIPLGVLSVNEVREEIGYDTLPDPKADEHRLDKPEPPAFGAFGIPPSRGGNDEDDEERDAGSQGADGEDDDAPPSESKSAPAPACECGCKVKKSRRQVKDDRFAETDKQRKLTAEMQAAVERWYTAITVANAMNAGGIIDLTMYEGELAAAIRPFIVQMFAEGVREGLVTVNQTREDAFDVFPDRAVGFMEQYTIRLARDISHTTRDELNLAIRQGLEAGVNLDDVTKRVQVALGEESKWKAERIARTEIMRAQNEGNVETWKRLGIEKKQWLLAPNPCPKCAAVASMFEGGRDVGTPFLKVGDTFTDTEGNLSTITYRDINTPPLHPNCKCKVIAVL